jgi:hypothetical protein
MLYWEVYSQLGLYRPRVVLTVHNLDNTGECRQDEFAYTGVWGRVLRAARARACVGVRACACAYVCLCLCACVPVCLCARVPV